MEVVAAEDNCSKPTSPVPENSYDEVSSCDWRGNRKIRLQVWPAYEVGMSKLKMVDTLEEMVPKYWVPNAVSGDVEETGTIKCGYW